MSPGMGESFRVNVPDRVEPAWSGERFKLIVSIMLACITPALAMRSVTERTAFMLGVTFLRLGTQYKHGFPYQLRSFINHEFLILHPEDLSGMYIVAHGPAQYIIRLRALERLME